MIFRNAFQPMMGEELKACRKRLCLSQENMARKLRISVRSYIDLEHGSNGISALTLVYFMELLAPDQQVRILKAMRDMLP